MFLCEWVSPPVSVLGRVTLHARPLCRVRACEYGAQAVRPTAVFSWDETQVLAADEATNAVIVFDVRTGTLSHRLSGTLHAHIYAPCGFPPLSRCATVKAWRGGVRDGPH
jgi:hypothetical protein